MLEPIIVPSTSLPKPDPNDPDPCPCMFKPVKLTYKKGTVLWLKQLGEHVLAEEPICEGEVEKKTLVFFAPCSGILREICIPDDGIFSGGTILGYVERDL